MLGQVVLLIAEELQLKRLLRVTLNHNGAKLVECKTAEDAIELIGESQPDLVLLDLRLPDSNGTQAAEMLREHTDATIIALSATDDVQQRIAILDAGADDCLTIPFSWAEMLARARAAFRRSSRSRRKSPPDAFQVSGLMVDFAAHEVRVQGASVHLTPTEYKLLRMLVTAAGKVVTHQELLSEVWGPDATSQVHYLRVYMKQLRRKLEPGPKFPRYLLTVPTVGYRLAQSA